MQRTPCKCQGLHHQGLIRASILLGCVLVVGGCVRSQQSVISPNIRARNADKLESIFREANPAWQGGDIATSVPLGSRRSLWLFGDSWIAPSETEGRRNAKLIGNSIGIYKRRMLRPDRIEYFWDTANGVPSSFFGTSLPDNKLWPISGIRLNETLVLFAYAATAADNALGFTLADNRLLIISNPDASPSEWKTVDYPIPFSRFAPDGVRSFGCAVLRQDESDYVFIFGYDKDPSSEIGGRRVILARAPSAALREADFDVWEFYGTSGWTRKPDDARALFDDAASEMSVHYLSAYGKYVAVYNAIGISPDIVARFADAPEGPWSNPTLLYRCPEPGRNENYFCYAGKSHAELSKRSRDLIVSYATNSTDFGDHFRDADLYWPRFVKITLPPKYAIAP